MLCKLNSEFFPHTVDRILNIIILANSQWEWR